LNKKRILQVMKCYFAIAIFIAVIFTGCINTLENEVKTLHLRYIAWACDCANWATDEDIKKYGGDNNGALDDRCIFLEPADDAKELPISILRSGTEIRVTGQFYENKGFPEGYTSVEHPDKARVFRYTGFKVLRTHLDDE